MTPEQQRIKIAEACGWTCDTSQQEHDFDRWIDLRGVRHFTPPDYLTDLNAMHEAEKVLDDEQWNTYQVLLRSQVPYNKARGVTRCIAATASQRAEAFLGTLNEWN